MEKDEIKQYLLKKGYKIENVNIALEGEKYKQEETCLRKQ